MWSVTATTLLAAFLFTTAECGKTKTSIEGKVNASPIVLLHRSDATPQKDGRCRFSYCVNNLGERPTFVDWKDVGLKSHIPVGKNVYVSRERESAAPKKTKTILWWGPRPVETTALAYMPTSIRVDDNRIINPLQTTNRIRVYVPHTSTSTPDETKSTLVEIEFKSTLQVEFIEETVRLSYTLSWKHLGAPQKHLGIGTKEPPVQFFIQLDKIGISSTTNKSLFSKTTSKSSPAIPPNDSRLPFHSGRTSYFQIALSDFNRAPHIDNSLYPKVITAKVNFLSHDGVPTASADISFLVPNKWK